MEKKAGRLDIKGKRKNECKRRRKEATGTHFKNQPGSEAEATDSKQSLQVVRQKWEQKGAISHTLWLLPIAGHIVWGLTLFSKFLLFQVLN